MATGQQAVAMVVSVWKSCTSITVFLFPNKNCLILSCALNPRFASLCCPVLDVQFQKQHSTKCSWSRNVSCRSICWYLSSSSSQNSYAESQWWSTVSLKAAWLLSCQYLPINANRRILNRPVMLTSASSMLPDSSLKMNEPTRTQRIIGCSRKNNGSLTADSNFPLSTGRYPTIHCEKHWECIEPSSSALNPGMPHRLQGVYTDRALCCVDAAPQAKWLKPVHGKQYELTQSN